MVKKKDQTRPEVKEVDRQIKDLVRRKPTKKPEKKKPEPSDK